MPPWNTGKAHLADRLDVADQPVGHAACGAAHLRCRAQQLAPGCDPVGRPVAGEHRDVAGLEIVDERDLDLVGVLARRHLVARHVEPGAGAAEQDQALVERPHERPHRLLHQAQPVHHVRSTAA